MRRSLGLLASQPRLLREVKGNRRKYLRNASLFMYTGLYLSTQPVVFEPSFTSPSTILGDINSILDDCSKESEFSLSSDA